MRTPTPYEKHLSSCRDRYGVKSDNGFRIPIFIVNEKRACDWMLDLYHAMTPWNGYTVSKQLRFRIRHAPETHCRKLLYMSAGMYQMLDDFCDIMQRINERIFNRFDGEDTVVLMTRQDRTEWDHAIEALHDLLYDDRYLKDSEEGVDLSVTALYPFDKL